MGFGQPCMKYHRKPHKNHTPHSYFRTSFCYMCNDMDCVKTTDGEYKFSKTMTVCLRYNYFYDKIRYPWKLYVLACTNLGSISKNGWAVECKFSSWVKYSPTSYNSNALLYLYLFSRQSYNLRTICVSVAMADDKTS